MYSIDNQDERDQLDIEGVFIRISLLMRYGCLPYIMRHCNYQNSKYKGLYIQIARWCNQPQFFKKKSFAEFCITNQEYAKSDKKCASYKAYLDFKEECPEISEKYFNIRYDEMVATNTINSYGRVKETTPCIFCENPKLWDMDRKSKRKTVIDYYSNKLDQLCIYCRPVIPVNEQCDIDESDLGDHLYVSLIHADYDLILDGIDKMDDFELSPSLIPQLNDYTIAYTEVIDLINADGSNLTYKDIGKNCSKCLSSTSGSHTKYGECQIKILMMTDLVWKHHGCFKLTPLGKVFVSLPNEEREEIFKKLILKVPFIQKIMKQAGDGIEVNITNWLSESLSTSTVKRRAGPIKKMIDDLKGLNEKLDQRLKLIKL